MEWEQWEFEEYLPDSERRSLIVFDTILEEDKSVHRETAVKLTISKLFDSCDGAIVQIG